MEIQLFHHKPKKTLLTPPKALKNLTRTVDAATFLSENKRPQLLQSMQSFCGLDEARYESMCAALIGNVIDYCQKLPATLNSYYSQPGGLADHALNRTEAALSSFQEFVIPEEDECLSEEQKLWQYALYSAAMLVNIGTLYVDYKINTFDAQGNALKTWNPLLEKLNHSQRQYDYELTKEPELSFRHRLNLLLAKTLMPLSGYSWIASNPQVFAVWLALLNEDYQSAGTLGALLIRADAVAIQRYFSELMNRVSKRNTQGPSSSFIDTTPEALLEKDQALGLEFLQWLTQSMEEGKLLLNKEPLLMVPGRLVMTQKLFEMFSNQNWQKVQMGFLALGLYVLGGDGRAVLRVDHATKGAVNGVLFAKYAMILPTSVTNEKGERINTLQAIQRIENAGREPAPLQKLTASGQWKTVNIDSQPASPGMVKHRG